MKIADLAHDLEPYILEIIEHSAFSGPSSSSGTASGFAPSPHNLFGEHHNGVLDRTQAPWIAADIQSSIDAHSIDPDAHTALTSLQITSTGTTAFQVGDGSTGYAKIGDAGWYDDGVYFSPLGTRQFYIRSTVPNTYIYSPDIYIGQVGGGTTLRLRANTVTADNWNITPAGAANFVTADVSQSANFGASTIRMIYHSTPSPHSHLVVNPTGSWSLDEQFGVDIDDNLLVRGYIVGKHAIQIKDAMLIAHYDGYGPFKTNYTGEPNGHMGQIATVNGATAYVEGLFGKAIMFSASGFNNAQNPSIESGAVTNWSIQYTSGTMVQSAYSSDSYIGTYCAYMSSSLSSNVAVFNDKHFHGPTSNATWPIGTTTTISMRVKVLSGTWTITAEDSGQNVRALSGTLSPTDDWQYVTLTATNTSAVNYSYLIAAFWPRSVNSQILVDVVKYENAAYATPYFDGTFGSGFSWGGVANISYTTKTANYITYPTSGNFNAPKGSVMAWVKLSGVSSGRQTILDVGGSGNTGWILSISNGIPFFQYGTGSATVTVTSSIPITADTWTHIACTWSNITNTAYIYVNGVQAGTGSGSPSVVVFANMLVGLQQGTIHYLDGYLDDLVIVSRVMSESEIRAVYESNAPVFGETSTFQFRAGQNLVWADTDGLWTLDTAGNAVFGVYGNGNTTKTWGGLTLSVGDVLIGSASRGGYVFWDNSAATVAIRGSVTIDQASSLTGSGTLKIGTGTKDSTLNGWQFDTSEFVGQSNGVDQVVLNATTGKLTAGAGSVTLDASGAWLTAGSNDVNKLRWLNGSTRIAQLYSTVSGSTETYLESKGTNAFSASNLRLLATHGDDSATHSASLTIGSSLSSPGIYLTTGSVSSYFQSSGIYLGVGTYIEQPNGSGGTPVLTLDQNDSTGPLIEIAAVSGFGKTLDTLASAGTYYGRIKFTVNGVAKYLHLFNA